jgi:hypothetical protein
MTCPSRRGLVGAVTVVVSLCVTVVVTGEVIVVVTVVGAPGARVVVTVSLTVRSNVFVTSFTGAAERPA